MNELALFAGAGGVLGGALLGWRTVCAVEHNAYCAAVLAQRQNDGLLEPFPVWSDVSTFDGRPWRGIADVVSGGFPCQDISVAGKGAGITGAKSGLWKHFARIIGEVVPAFVLIENVPALRTRGLVTVLSDLAALGYDARWGVLGAVDVGAPHKRDRMWIVANATQQHGPFDGQQAPELGRSSETVAYAHSAREQQQEGRVKEQRGRAGECSWWQAEPSVGRMVDGVAHRVDRLRALGNGQVPAVAALAWKELVR